MNDQEKIQFMLSTAEQFYGTENDDSQIPITNEALNKLLSLGHNNLFFTERDGRPAGWIATVPVTIEQKDKFLSGEITERELFDRAQPIKHPGAVYLCSAFVLSEYRNQGIAKTLFVDQIKYFLTLNPNVTFFAWIYSKEGERLIESLKKTLNIEVEIKR